MQSRSASRRWRRSSVDATRRDGSRIEQDNTCQNGNADCPGPNSGTSALPCTACFVEGMQDG
jgi:hypothetical protein